MDQYLTNYNEVRDNNLSKMNVHWAICPHLISVSQIDL